MIRTHGDPTRAGARYLDTQSRIGTAEAEQSTPAGTTGGEPVPGEAPIEVPASKRAELLASVRAAALIPPTEPPGGWRPTSLTHLQRWKGSSYGMAFLRSRGVDPLSDRYGDLWAVYRDWLASYNAVRDAREAEQLMPPPVIEAG